jgi:hypothetical protein
MDALINTALNPIADRVRSSGLLDSDIDYHIVRASMVIMFFFFGYQKWFPYEYERLVPFISNGPLIWWLYPVFGVRGGPAGSSASPNGPSAPCCSQASGTSRSASSVR